LSAADLPTIDAPIINVARWLVHEREFSVIALDHPANAVDVAAPARRQAKRASRRLANEEVESR
jgi:hypothetical protein